MSELEPAAGGEVRFRSDGLAGSEPRPGSASDENSLEGSGFRESTAAMASATAIRWVGGVSNGGEGDGTEVGETGARPSARPGSRGCFRGEVPWPDFRGSGAGANRTTSISTTGLLSPFGDGRAAILSSGASMAKATAALNAHRKAPRQARRSCPAEAFDIFCWERLIMA